MSGARSNLMNLRVLVIGNDHYLIHQCLILCFGHTGNCFWAVSFGHSITCSRRHFFRSSLLVRREDSLFFGVIHRHTGVIRRHTACCCSSNSRLFRVSRGLIGPKTLIRVPRVPQVGVVGDMYTGFFQSRESRECLLANLDTPRSSLPFDVISNASVARGASSYHADGHTLHIGHTLGTHYTLC